MVVESNGVASKLQPHLCVLQGSFIVTAEPTHLLTASECFYVMGAELSIRGETFGLPKLEIFTAWPFLGSGMFQCLVGGGSCSFFSVVINVKPFWPSL